MHVFQVQQKKSTAAGFSLVEVLVSMSIFTIVVGMAVSTTIVLIDANSKAQTMQQATTNLSFALDSFARTVRTGTHYYSRIDSVNPSLGLTDTRDCRNGERCRSISFTESGGALTGGPGGCAGADGGGRISYRFNESEASLERRLCGGSWQRMTSPEIEITEFRFTLRYSGRADERQPVVVLYTEAIVGSLPDTQTPIRLQTGVGQQAIDI